MTGALPVEIGLAPGSCVIQLRTHPVTRRERLWVLEADPRIWISADLLEKMAKDMHPDVTLKDDVLTIDAKNRRVVYRIGRYLAQPHAYEAEWPD